LPDRQLTIAVWDYDRTRALQDGRVKPEGMQLTFLPLGMPESFFRMLRHGEFDISEMSLSWYTRTLFHEPRPFIAIPVFPSRMFRHSSIYVNARSGINEPRDLIGKRIGCPEYQMTAAVWVKGIMADHYGVPVDSVTYHTGGLKEPGRREMPMNLPSNISVTPIPEHQTLSELLERGDIDALYTAEMPTGFIERSPNVRRLFPDYAGEERAFFEKTGIFPIMHTVVIKASLLERDPWIAQSVTKAFIAAQEIAYRDLYDTTALKTMLPWLTAHVEETRAVMGGDDYWPYGLSRNHDTLANFLRYSNEQGLTPRLLEPEELFAASTLLTSRT
jgi:4,5-dihydroxyphthalate decarboxylase